MLRWKCCDILQKRRDEDNNKSLMMFADTEKKEKVQVEERRDLK